MIELDDKGSQIVGQTFDFEHMFEILPGVEEKRMLLLIKHYMLLECEQCHHAYGKETDGCDDAYVEVFH